MEDFDLDLKFDLFDANPTAVPFDDDDAPPPEPVKAAPEAPETSVYRHAITYHHTRRVWSEIALENQLPWHFEPGHSYHIISGGDVDSLTYFRHILKQQKLEWALISTWCMALEDVKEIQNWLAAGYVGRVDFYLGEIFRNTYGSIYSYLKDNALVEGSRLCIFRNHSKVMVGYGEKFDFVIESSSNVNTNPRTEQTCITLDPGLVEFYKDFYDNVSNFMRENDTDHNYKPYKRK